MTDTPVRIVVSPRRRKTAVSVSAGVISLHVPREISRQEAERILSLNRRVIDRLLARDAALPRSCMPELCLGALWPMLGNFYPLTLGSASGFDGRAFTVTSAEPDRIKKELHLIYSNHAAGFISRKVFAMSRRYGFAYRSVNINSASTRWGSCSSAGVLNFSWKLILMPEKLVEYVVAHELSHLREMNHSARFWQEVSRICPDWRECRRELKEKALLFRAW